MKSPVNDSPAESNELQPSEVGEPSPQVRPSRWKAWFFPNCADALFVLISFLLTMAVLGPWSELFFLDLRMDRFTGQLWNSAFGGSLVALAFALGRHRLNPQVAVAASIGYVASFGLLWLATNEVVGDFEFEGNHQYREFVYSELPFQNWIRILGFEAIGFLVIAILIWMVTKSGGWVKQKLVPGGKLSRQSWIVVVAFSLFVLQLVQRIVFSERFASFRAGQFVFGGIVLATCVVLAGNCLTGSHWKFRKKAITVSLLIGAWGVVLIFFPTNVSEPPLIRLVAMSLVFGFLVTALVANFPKQSHGNKTGLRFAKPSLWSLFPMFVLTLSCCGVFGFDSLTLTHSNWKDWGNARTAKRIANRSSGQVKIIPDWWAAQPTAKCNLQSDSGESVLVPLRNMSLNRLQISGMHPGIDSAPLSTVGASELLLQQSRVSAAQLDDVFQAGAIRLMLSNVEVVDDDRQIDIAGSSLVIEVSKPNQLSSILDVIDPESSRGSIELVHGELSRRDLASMKRLAKQLPIILQTPPTDRFAADGVVLDLSWDFCYGEGPDTRQTIRDIVESDLFVVLPFFEMDQLFLELMFAKNKMVFGEFNTRYWFDDEFLQISRDHTERCHLLYGSNEQGEVTDAFLPCMEGSVNWLAELSSIETVSFDPYWLSGLDAVSIQRIEMELASYLVADLQVESLPNLRRIDFSCYAEISDAKILTRIPNVEHLQIRLDSSAEKSVDFSVCQNLTRLVYFGTPPTTMLKQLASLKSLESVTIVELPNGFPLPKSARSKFKTAVPTIPGVKVVGVAFRDYRPTAPAKFQKYVEAKSAELRKKLLE